MISRRVFLAGLGVTLALPCSAPGQPARNIYKVGTLSQASAATGDPYTDAFLQGLRESGYIEGNSLILERRYADGKFERLPDLAADLATLKLDVIFARSSRAVTAARNATHTTPIVALDLESDPVAMGFVAAIARPSGNVTGIFLDLPEVSAKQVDLLAEVVPQLSRVAVLGDAAINASHIRAVREAALVRRLQIQALEAESAAEVDRVLKLATKGRNRGLIVLSSSFLFLQRGRIAEVALKNGLATIGMWREFVDAGGLMTYGANLLDLHRRCAVYVDKILKGAKPGELPVERPAEFEFVVNMKTAKALGLTIPSSLLQRADQVIE